MKLTIYEPNYKWSAAPVPRSETQELILHHAAASNVSAEEIHEWHLAKGWRGIAYHYYVRTDGKIYRGRPENTIGGHTSGENYRSIGICFEGNFELEEMPREQLLSGRALVSDIRSRYPCIEINRHKEFNATACPGKNFPFEEIVTAEETALVFETLSDVPEYYRPAIEKLMQSGALVGEYDPNPDTLEDNIINVDVTYCRVMTTLDRLGLI